MACGRVTRGVALGVVACLFMSACGGPSATPSPSASAAGDVRAEVAALGQLVGGTQPRSSVDPQIQADFNTIEARMLNGVSSVQRRVVGEHLVGGQQCGVRGAGRRRCDVLR